MATLFSVRYGMNLYVVRRFAGRAVAQAVSCRPLTTRIRSKVSPCEVCGGRNGTVTGFSLSILVFPMYMSYHQCSALIYIYTLLLPAGHRSKAWEPSKKQFSFGNPGTLDRKVLSVFDFLTRRVSNG
jgi:hypothetical protein